MASKPEPKKAVRKLSTYPYFRRFVAGLCLLCTIVVMAAGVMHGVRISRVIYRAGEVNFIILMLGWIIMKVMASYEEINSGQV